MGLRVEDPGRNMFWKRPTHQVSDTHENRFLVVHPLDDTPEPKIETERLGRMPMTASVRISLVALRLYLLVMVALVLYRVLDLSGVLHGAV